MIGDNTYLKLAIIVVAAAILGFWAGRYLPPSEQPPDALREGIDNLDEDLLTLDLVNEEVGDTNADIPEPVE